MDTEEVLLRGIRENPGDQDRWPVLADALEEKGDPRAELVRLWHAIRQAPAHPQRPGWEERLCTLLGSGLRPCVPGLTNSIGMAFSLVPPGTSLMGSPEDEVGRTSDEGPQHEVEISRPFYLGVYPVTQEEFKRVLRRSPSHFKPRGRGRDLVKGLDTRSFPVDNVSWQDAVRFCTALSDLPLERAAGRVYRLPTECEWEYACRAAGTCSGPFHLGQTLSSTQANFDGTSPYRGAPPGPALRRTTAVGSYPPNVLGLYDMYSLGQRSRPRHPPFLPVN